MNIGLRHTHTVGCYRTICCFQTKVLTVIVVKNLGMTSDLANPCLKLDDRAVISPL